MEEKTKKAIELHIAGATISHKSYFEDLETYDYKLKLDKEFVDKWVLPFYMVGINNTEKFSSNYSKVKSELNIEIVKRLLGTFNWRTRIVGAYFSVIENFTEMEDIIGNHLLKSEVCYAGGGYCLVLASFNTENGINYLRRYLDYYLTRKKLYFEQQEAMCALDWTDRQNGTNLMQEYLPKYKEWVSDKYGQNMELNVREFDKQIELLKQIKASC